MSNQSNPSIVVEFIIYIMALNTLWFLGLGLWELLKDLFKDLFKDNGDPYDF